MRPAERTFLQKTSVKTAFWRQNLHKHRPAHSGSSVRGKTLRGLNKKLKNGVIKREIHCRRIKNVAVLSSWKVDVWETRAVTKSCSCGPSAERRRQMSPGEIASAWFKSSLLMGSVSPAGRMLPSPREGRGSVRRLEIPGRAPEPPPSDTLSALHHRHDFHCSSRAGGAPSGEKKRKEKNKYGGNRSASVQTLLI